jgi:peroxiredoxin
MSRVLVSLLAFCLVACGSEDSNQQQVDAIQPLTDWRLVVHLPDVELPVRLHLSRDGGESWLQNGREKVVISEVEKQGDNWRLFFPAFNNTLVLRQQGERLEGSLTLVKRGYEQHMDVSGEPDPGYRFVADPEPEAEFTGRWEVTFVQDNGKESFAIGEFDQQGGKVTGTFLTAKGDYRYLAGEVDGNTLYLSTLDGAHAFVFKAKMQPDGSLEGDFWSGTRWHESWKGTRNFDAQLPDAYSLTYLKEGYDQVEFSFPDLDGNPVSLADEKFLGKVVLVTLSGTWCPNCADEAEFLAGYYRENRDRGLEVVTLLYEHFDDFKLAAQRGRALQAKHEIEFDLLIAGSSDKKLAAETLPMLNHVLAFPTIIFIDRQANVRRIHTGFSGPGTGQHYQQFLGEFNALMEELLQEKAGR